MLRQVIYLVGLFAPVLSQDACSSSSGGVGKCGRISSCPELKRILQVVRSDSTRSDYKTILKNSICGFKNHLPLVCCEESTRTPQVNLSTFKQPHIRNRFSPSLDLLPSRKSCGKIAQIADRIIGGEDAGLGSWPWIVQMAGKTSKGDWIHFCAGSLISARYVISAAHCFRSSNPVQLAFVRLGEHNTDTARDCIRLGRRSICAPATQDITVEKIISHPDYARRCIDCNDIAVLRLSNPAEITDYVSPICLPFHPEEDMGFSVNEFQGKVAAAAGWGSTIGNPNSKEKPAILKHVDLTIQELDFCRRTKRKYQDPTTVFCAGGNGKDTCRGDSGGPLTLSNNFLTQFYLVGVTSIGPNVCGSPNTQGIYTNIDSYLNWITSVIEP